MIGMNLNYQNYINLVKQLNLAGTSECELIGADKNKNVYVKESNQGWLEKIYCIKNNETLTEITQKVIHPNISTTDLFSKSLIEITNLPKLTINPSKKWNSTWKFLTKTKYKKNSLFSCNFKSSHPFLQQAVKASKIEEKEFERILHKIAKKQPYDCPKKIVGILFDKIISTAKINNNISMIVRATIILFEMKKKYYQIDNAGIKRTHGARTIFRLQILDNTKRKLLTVSTNDLSQPYNLLYHNDNIYVACWGNYLTNNNIKIYKTEKVLN